MRKTKKLNLEGGMYFVDLLKCFIIANSSIQTLWTTTILAYWIHYFRLSNLLCSIDSRFQKMFGGYENYEYGFEELHLSPNHNDIFWTEISMAVEISTDCDLLSIIEFQIYSFILPILQANLGKMLAKILWNCYILKLNTIYLFLKSFQMKNFELHSQSDLFSESVSCSSSAP